MILFHKWLLTNRLSMRVNSVIVWIYMMLPLVAYVVIPALTVRLLLTEVGHYEKSMIALTCTFALTSLTYSRFFRASSRALDAAQLELMKKRQTGQGLVEYTLILVLVAVVVIVILALVGPAVGNVFSNISGYQDRVNATQAAEEFNRQEAIIDLCMQTEQYTMDQCIARSVGR